MVHNHIDNSTKNGAFKDKNINLAVKDPRTNLSYDLKIGEATININNTDNKFDISVAKNKAIDGEFAGIFGLNMWVIGNKFDAFIEQWYKKDLISNKTLYIGSYYERGNLKKESKLVIGKIPDEIKINFGNISNCSMVSSKNSYQCNISKFKFGKNKISPSKIINVNFIEGKKDKTILPISLIEYFNKSLNELIIKNKDNEKGKYTGICTIDGNKIICPGNKIKISFFINEQEFKLNTIWENNTI